MNGALALLIACQSSRRLKMSLPPAAIQKIMALGANVTDPADMPSALEIPQSNNESIVLYTDFKVDLGTYLMELGGDITTGVRSLEDAIKCVVVPSALYSRGIAG